MADSSSALSSRSRLMPLGCASPKFRPPGAIAPPARAGSGCGPGCRATYAGTRWGSPPASGRRRRERPVVALVVVPVLTGLQRTPPLGMVDIPAHGLLQSFLEGDPWLPTEVGDPRHIERIAVIVARTVGDVLDEAFGLANDLQHRIGDVIAIRLDARPDVVDGILQRRLVQYEIDGAAVVFNVDVVPHRRAVVVERQWQVIDGVGNQYRHDLFRVLVGPKRVRASRHKQRQPEALGVRARDVLAARLARRVGTARLERIAFARAAFAHLAINLVRADKQKDAMRVLSCRLAKDGRSSLVGVVETERHQGRPI